MVVVMLCEQETLSPPYSQTFRAENFSTLTLFYSAHQAAQVSGMIEFKNADFVYGMLVAGHKSNNWSQSLICITFK